MHESPPGAQSQTSKDESTWFYDSLREGTVIIYKRVNSLIWFISSNSCALLRVLTSDGF